MNAEWTQTPRVAPHSLQAEVSVIGSILLDPDLLTHSLVGQMRPEDFYREAHRLIWQTFEALRAEGTPPDLTMLASHLMRAGKLDAAGGMVYLAGLGEQVPTAAHAEHYARIVLEHAHLRRLITHSADVARHAYAGDMPLEDLQALAENAPELDLGDDDGLVHLGDALSDILAEAESGSGERGLPTGLTELDGAMNGLERGRLYILAARPGMGKSGLAFQIAAHVAQQGGHTLGFSLEMPAKEISARIMSSESRVGLARLTQSRRGDAGALNARDLARLRETRDRLADTPFSILPKPGLRLPELIAQVHRAHQRRPLSLFVLDYLQLVQVAGRGGDNITGRVTEITNALKALALELDIPVLALSQLSRAVEQRPNHRPQLSDLRESGSIEQDADVVMFIYRDEKYNPDTDQRGIAELIIGKNRNGPTDTVRVQFKDQFVRFQDLDIL